MDWSQCPNVWCEWILQFAPAMFQGCQKPCLNRDGMHQFRRWELQIEGCYMDATVLWTLDPVACEYGGRFHMSWAWTALFINIFFHQCLLVSSVRVFSMLFVSSGRLPAAQWTIFFGSETDLWDRGCPGSLQLELDPGQDGTLGFASTAARDSHYIYRFVFQRDIA